MISRFLYYLEIVISNSTTINNIINVVNTTNLCNKHSLCDSLLELHKTLEGVKQKNGIYKAASMYGLAFRQRQQKTIDAYNRLPEEFTVDDVIRCFNLNSGSSARMRIARLTKDRLAEKINEMVIDGHKQAIYRKTDSIMIS